MGQNGWMPSKKGLVSAIHVETDGNGGHIKAVIHPPPYQQFLPSSYFQTLSFNLSIKFGPLAKLDNSISSSVLWLYLNKEATNFGRR